MDGTGTGSFTSSISGLTPNTTYYVRAYATNSVGTSYGNEINFTTASIQLPVLTTTAISNIGQTTSTSGGTISSDGGGEIIERGVVWSTSQNPTVALSTKTIDGSGIGAFSSNIISLAANTQYYVRAYATNSAGTAYGNEVNFTTLTPNYAAMYPTGTVFCNNVVTAVVDVTNPVTGKTWMDRNLGASQVATSSTDAAAYGDLYQWGRRADGHQCRNSGTTSTLSSSDQPSHGNFILGSTSGNWQTTPNLNLWQGLNGSNNPCPIGYRVPTLYELQAESATWSVQNIEGAYSSLLKMSRGGNRNNSGNFNEEGLIGNYWSNTITILSSGAEGLSLTNNFVAQLSGPKAMGLSVRCIKN
ncbi:MAG: hypothetical protein NWQ15_10115 [Flavobacterium sp.]|nr:hypothetical protein [Flavobacterium sp.]